MFSWCRLAMDPRTGSEHYKQCLNTFCLGFGSVKLLNLNLNEGSGSGSEWTRTTHYITSFHFPNPTCLFVSWWIHLGTLFVCDKVQITWKWLKSAQQKLHKQTNNNHWSFFETSCSLPLTMMWGGQHDPVDFFLTMNIVWNLKWTFRTWTLSSGLCSPPAWTIPQDAGSGTGPRPPNPSQTEPWPAYRLPYHG